MPYKVHTAKDENSPQIETILTVDWTGVTAEMERQFSARSLIIKWQGRVRKKGIPATASIKAVDYMSGTRLTELTPEEVLAQAKAVAKDDREARARLIAELQAMGE